MKANRDNANPSGIANVSILASAGSGKTFALVERYVELLASGAQPHEILATTFTRKAAGEITSRVFSKLMDLVQKSDPNAECPIDPAVASALFNQMVDELDQLQIGTLDGVLHQAVARHGFELGFPMEWTVMEEADANRLRREAIAHLLADEGHLAAAELSRLLAKGEIQRSVSRQLLETVAELFSQFADLSDSAWEKIPPASSLLPHQLEAVLAEIEAYDLSSEKRMVEARDKDLECARAGDWQKWLEQGLAKAVFQNNATYYRKDIPEGLVKSYRRLIDHARAVRLNLYAHQTAATRRLLEAFKSRFRARQQQQGLYLFDDLSRVLVSHPLDAERRADWLGPAIRHLLIDEFQDTSPAQWASIAPLAQRCAAAGTFLVVGDPKQAIYSWRGGVAELFDVLEGAIPKLSWRELTESYRSSSVVLDVVNRIFEALPTNPTLRPDRSAAERWSKRFQRHEPAKRRAGYACLMTSTGDADEDDSNDESSEGQGADQSHLDFVAKKVQQLSTMHSAATIGVLVRRNRMVGELLFRLRQLGLAASEEGGNPLSVSPAVSVILSLLDATDHPTSSVHRFHVENSPLGDRLGLKPGASPEEWSACTVRLRQEFSQAGYGRTVRRLVNILVPGLSIIENQRLDQLVELAIAYDERSTPRLRDFVAYVESTRVEDPRSARIRVMTIHQAKGLEFDIVVLPELDGRIRPNPPTMVARRPNPSAEIDAVCRYVNKNDQALLSAELQTMFDVHREGEVIDALCNLYVAITRAVHGLYMIIQPSRDNERTIPRTFAGILRSALTDGAPVDADRILFEDGDPEWSRHPGEDDVEDEDARPSPPAKTRYLAPVQWAQTSKRLAYLSPSGSEQHAFSARRALCVERRSLDEGTVLHEWCSRIDWLYDGEPTKTLDLGSRLLTPEKLEPLRERFHQYLQSQEVRRVFERPKGEGREVELWKERRFAVVTDDGFVSGAIDRMTIVRENGKVQEIEIVDFKSDQVADEAGAKARAQAYVPQMSLYRQAVARMFDFPADKIGVTLVFLHAGVVVNV